MPKTNTKRGASRNAEKIRQAHATAIEDRAVRTVSAQVRRVDKRKPRRSGLAAFAHELPILTSAISVVLLALVLWGGFGFAQKNQLGPFAPKFDACLWADAPANFKLSGPIVRHYSAPPRTCITAGTHGLYLATIHTARGNIVMEVDQTKAPVAVNNFVFLATHGFYNGLTFHRVVPQFVIQTGDPRSINPKADTSQGATDGSDGPGYTFNDVLPSTYPSVYSAGAVAMANPGKPSQSGSQFFITTADDTQRLQDNYIFFGRISNPSLAIAQAMVQGDTISSITVSYDPNATAGIIPDALNATPTPALTATP